MVAAAVVAAQQLPKPTGRVNDFANVIDAATEAEIDRRLDQLEQQTSSEIAVATIPSLEGISVEEYANRLFKEWGVGQAKQDNGVLVLVAPTDREMRVEVGYGLEGVLPDGLAGQVIRDDFTPRFKEGDYSGGILAGVNHLADIVQKHQVLTPEEIAKLNESGSSNVPYFLIIPFFGIFVTIGFGMLGIGLRSKTGFPVLFGSFFGGMPLLMSLAFLGKIWLYTLFPLAILVFIQGAAAWRTSHLAQRVSQWQQRQWQGRLIEWLDDGRRFGLGFIIIEFVLVQQLRRWILGRGRSERAVVGKREFGAAGVAIVCTLLTTCAALPAAQERERVTQALRSGPNVTMANVECGSSLLAGDALCADVVMRDGARFRFEHLGFNSLGSTAVNVVVAKAGRLEPRVASCSSVAPANFQRTGPLGHHFNPTLIDLKGACALSRNAGGS